MFVLIGAGMGPPTIEIVSEFPLRTTMGGTSVRVTSGSTNADCLMIYL